MPSTNPPELPRLPPIRESAEQALPPPPDEAAVATGGTVEEPPRQRPPQRSPGRPATDSDRQARRSPRSEDGRRLSTAGHALVVAVLGLLFGALLIAPGMHKAAFNGQPGTKRDVSLALTGALTHVSHALLLDRPRRLAQDAVGRGDADRIDVAIVIPPTTVAPKPRSKPTKQVPDQAVAEAPREGRVHPQEEAAALDRG